MPIKTRDDSRIKGDVITWKVVRTAPPITSLAVGLKWMSAYKPKAEQSVQNIGQMKARLGLLKVMDFNSEENIPGLFDDFGTPDRRVWTVGSREGTGNHGRTNNRLETEVGKGIGFDFGSHCTRLISSRRIGGWVSCHEHFFSNRRGLLPAEQL